MNLPKLKKTVKSFLLGEEGKISKTSIIKVGLTVASLAAFSSLISESVIAVPSRHGSCHATVNCPGKSAVRLSKSSYCNDVTGSHHASVDCNVEDTCHTNSLTSFAGAKISHTNNSDTIHSSTGENEGTCT